MNLPPKSSIDDLDPISSLGSLRRALPRALSAALTPVEGRRGLFTDAKGHLHFIPEEENAPKQNRPSGTWSYANTSFSPLPGDKIFIPAYGCFGVVYPSQGHDPQYICYGPPSKLPPPGSQWERKVPRISCPPDRMCDRPHGFIGVHNIHWLEAYPWES